MAIPDDLKFDVRVRDRLLSRGLVTEAEIDKHVKALPDLEAQAVELTPKQPALQKESDRDIVIVKTSGVRPPIAPVMRDDSDLPIPDDDDLDDDLDDVKAKKPEKVVAKPAADADEDDDEDEDDDDDEDDEDEDEDKEEKDAGDKAEAPKDDDWGG